MLNSFQTKKRRILLLVIVCLCNISVERWSVDDRIQRKSTLKKAVCSFTVIQYWKRSGGVKSWHTNMPVPVVCTFRYFCARLYRHKVAINTLMAVGLGYLVLALIGVHYRHTYHESSNEMHQEVYAFRFILCCNNIIAKRLKHIL